MEGAVMRWARPRRRLQRPLGVKDKMRLVCDRCGIIYCDKESIDMVQEKGCDVACHSESGRHRSERNRSLSDHRVQGRTSVKDDACKLVALD
jgi:hypothetical protein